MSKLVQVQIEGNLTIKGIDLEIVDISKTKFMGIPEVSIQDSAGTIYKLVKGDRLALTVNAEVSPR